MPSFSSDVGDILKDLTDKLLRFETTQGNEAPAQEYLYDKLTELGFTTYRWQPDLDTLQSHPSFPSDFTDIPLHDRPSIGGVLEFGDPTKGNTLVLNGHIDIVPADHGWETEPFIPQWRDDTLVGRGAADMKAGLAASILSAVHLKHKRPNINGRIVVESVVGEEAGGIGAAMAALDNPYPFHRDAAIIAEPTNLTPIIACEGSLMKRLTLQGRSAHAATPWEGESVLPHFDAIRDAFDRLAMQRNTEITHPLFEEYPTPWPVNIGTVSAGSWASTVPASLTAEFRIGVAPMESVSEVEAQFDDQLQTVIEDRPWFSEYPPEFERFSVQFEPSEIDSDETIVKAVQNALSDAGLDSYKPVRGATYGTDARHYITADIPTVVFGPGSIEQAHFPNETIQWDEVLQFGNLLTEVSKIYLKSTDSTNAESPLQ